MAYGYDTPILIWAYGTFVEVANKAIAHYQEHIDSSVAFELIEITPQEIYDRLSDYANLEELPNIILVHDRELKKYLKEFHGVFCVLDNWLDASVYMTCKVANITHREHLYAVPCSSEPVALYYNKNILRDYIGEEELQEDIAWDDFIEIGRRLKEEVGIYLLPPANYLTQILMQSSGRLYYDMDGYISADGAQAVMELIELLNNEGLLYPDSSIPDDMVYDLMTQGSIFSIIGAPYCFTRIKQRVEYNATEIEWGLTKIPKSDQFQYDVDFGGYSWLLINKGSIDDQQLVVDFLIQIFNQDNECSRELIREIAETYDIVPTVNFVWDILDVLSNNGCFMDQQVVKYLLGISENTPEIYFGKYTEDITQSLNNIVETIVYNEETVTNGYSRFENICDDYINLDPPLVLQRIEIDQESQRTCYYKYECFDPLGMIVHAYFTDGTDAIVEGYNWMPSMLSLGDTYVTISYTSGGVTKEAIQPVSVLNRTITSITVSSRRTFLHGDTITASDFSVKANYDYGDSRNVTATSVYPNILSTEDEQEVTVDYEEEGIYLSEQTTITVYRKLDRIIISNKPKKLTYYKGERFNRTGLKIEAQYSNGESSVISSGALKIKPEIVKFRDGQDTSTITVSYTERGITKECALTVYKKTGVDLEDCDITQDMAASGTGTVNLSTGEFTYTINDFTGFDNIIPISISHIYKEGIGDTFHMGNNWRLNLQQELVKEDDNQWKYTDKKGKEYCFDDGYEVSAERSAIRNEKLGMDLFIDDENSIIKLVDRSNNILIFTLISGKYRLTAMHIYPSTIETPIEAYSLAIMYLTDGKISTVTAGKTINGSRPTIEFKYLNNRLSELQYSCLDNSIVARYSYNDGNLDAITLIDENTEAAFARATKFLYDDIKFSVCDMSSKNASGNVKTLSYSLKDPDSLDNIYRVYGYTIGYGEQEEDKTTITYSTKEISKEENTDISLTTITEHNGTVSVVSFNSMGVVAQYSYDIIDASYEKPKKVYSAQARGFSYKSLEETYSDTLTVYRDDFESGTDSWDGATANNSRAISDEYCVGGTSLSKSYTLTATDIEDNTTIYLSLWASTNTTSAIRVKVTVEGSENGEIIHCLDNNLTNKWQFTALCLGKRKIGDVINVELSCGTGTVYLDDVRLTKLPYETPEELAETEYDSFGNVTKSYQYNPIKKCVETTEYEYNSAHQVTAQTQTSEQTQKNKIVNTYSNGLLNYKKEYGASSSDYTQEQFIYTDNVITSSIDVNNTVTKYTEGEDFTNTIVVGDTNSPDSNQKMQFYQNSGVAKTLSSGALQNGFTYFEDGNMQKVKFHYSSSDYNAEISFEYDTFGNLSALKIGSIVLVTMEYDYKHLNKTIYANGDYLSYTYDAKDRITEIKENETATVSITYSDNAEDMVSISHSNGVIYTSKAINSNGKNGEYCANFSGVSRILKVVGYAANGTGNITTVGYFVDESETPFEKCISAKDSNGLLTKIERNYHGANNTYTYDDLYRLESKTTTYTTNSTSKQYKTNYSYQSITATRTGTQITTEKHYSDSTLIGTWNYTYYRNGNLAKIALGSNAQSEYVYDEYGRLVREDNYALSRSYQFTYDNGGNIIKKETYYITDGAVEDTPTKTDIYEYETVAEGCGQNSAWKDQLKSYNGTAITYDESGNPLNYLGKVMTWQGRRLTSIDGVALEYDYNGLRVKKGDRNYYWQSGNLVMERWEKNGTENYIYYYYDEGGVCGMNYNGTEYYYRKNIFGDVLAIYDSLGVLQCKYVYDAWGNHKVYNASGSEIGVEVINIGNVNPIRYRGYYWDKEFNLYYLQSRYYDPALGRFISADSIDYLAPEDVAGLNLYAYGLNNPVMYVDPTGHFVFSTMLVGALVGFGVSFVSSLVSQALVEQKLDWEMVGIAAIDGVFGGISGAIGGLGISAWTVGAINTGLSFANGIITTGIEQNWQFSAMDWGVIAGTSLLSGAISMRFYDQSAVKATNSFTSKIRGRIAGSYYGTGAKATKSIASATAQANKMVVKTFFAKDFYKEYLASLANTGLSQWASMAKYYLS